MGGTLCMRTGGTLCMRMSGTVCMRISIYSIIQSKADFTLLDEPFKHLMPIQVEK
jgi:ABC-type lipopolysaccharide export system ATPase subunit